MVRVLSSFLLPLAALALAVSAQQADLQQRSPLAAAAAPIDAAKRSFSHMAMHRQIIKRNESEALHRPFASEGATAYAAPTATVAAGAQVSGSGEVGGDVGTDPDEITTTTTAKVSKPTLAYGLKSRVRTSAGTYITLTSNQEGYGIEEVRADLKKIVAWAYAKKNVTPAQSNEIAAAVMSAAARYWPEVNTRAMCRVILADIKAESNFKVRAYDGGRMDSGPSIGLLQVSPAGRSKEMALWKNHAKVSSNTHTWDETNLAKELIDWQTGEQMKMSSLSFNDLYRPWINIHMAQWVQSNSARTSSQDPYNWQKIGAKAASGLSAFKMRTLLSGAGLSRSVKTGLGSWVAGCATNGRGSYQQRGDNISAPYFRNILAGVSVLYGSKKDGDWLKGLEVKAGLVDYRP